MTGGMCWEALNQIVAEKAPVICILNDNGMSIDPNVGALSQMLNQLRVAPSYIRLKEKTERHLERIPFIGKGLCKALSKLKAKLRHRVQPKSLFFAEMGFRCFGPVDGHDLSALIKTLEAASTVDEPVFIHVLTTKGKGNRHIEGQPELYHGVSAGLMLPKAETKDFKRQKASSVPHFLELKAEDRMRRILSAKTGTEAFSYALLDLASEEKRLCALTAAMAQGTGLSIFRDCFPERFSDVGIAEQHAVTMAAGLASQGQMPLVAIYATFMQRALDQLLHDVCLQQLPVMFVVDRDGLVGEDGETHQGLYDLAFEMACPHLEIWSVADAKALYQVLRYMRDETAKELSLCEKEQKVYSGTARMLRFARGPLALNFSEEISEEAKEQKTELNRMNAAPEPFRLLRAAKEDAPVLLSSGRLCHTLLELTKRLPFDVTLIQIQRLKPFPDEALLARLEKAPAIFCYEECAAPGVLAAQLRLALAKRAEHCVENSDLGAHGTPDQRPAAQRTPYVFEKNLGDRPVYHGATAELFKSLGFDLASLEADICDKMSRVKK